MKKTYLVQTPRPSLRGWAWRIVVDYEGFRIHVARGAAWRRRDARRACERALVGDIVAYAHSGDTVSVRHMATL